MRLFHTILVIGAISAASWAWHHHSTYAPDVADTAYTHAGAPEGHYRSATYPTGMESLYFAPGQNVERLDLSLIDHARSSITVAMYAFTDRNIARELVRAAHRGVHIRIYRDRRQFEQEQERGGSTSSILAGQPNIEVQIKGSTDLMHEKVMLVDGNTLRDGSSNWSVSAYRYQDNQVSIIHDKSQIEAFERDFHAMWIRPDNTTLQTSTR